VTAGAVAPGESEGDFRVLGDGRGFERAAGGDLAEKGDDFVAGDEFLGDGGGFAGFGLGSVLGDEFERAAENAAGGVGFLDGEEGAAVGGLAVGGFLAGEGGEFADLDGVVGGSGRGGGSGKGERGGEEEGESAKQARGGERHHEIMRMFRRAHRRGWEAGFQPNCAGSVAGQRGCCAAGARDRSLLGLAVGGGGPLIGGA